jgi:transitional endoplasmic reticulum ATPase
VGRKSEEGMRKIFERARQVALVSFSLMKLMLLLAEESRQGTKVTERVFNQLLAEMDGLEDLKSVIVIGATNRPDMIDTALLRPGRFDKILLVNAPDETGRLQILKIHTNKMPVGEQDKLLSEKEKEDFLKQIAKQTEGYTGADIESLTK